MNATFPLRDGYFRPLQYTPDDEARWRQTMVELVHRGLHEEAPYLATQYQFVDTARWKQVRSRDQLRAYRPRKSNSRLYHAKSQFILAVGTIEGTLEDVIYGTHHLSTHDIRVTTRFLSDDALDSAVLHIFDNGVPDDKFRHFGLKWRIVETPAGSLVKRRDTCMLEYMGIDYDYMGQRYAFHIAETFDHPVCPPFSGQCAVRAQIHFRAIYRQFSPGRVGVYCLGDYDFSGRMPGMLTRISTAEIAISLGRSVECAEAKKLTALALIKASTRKNAILSAHCGICGKGATQLCQLCGAAACGKCRVRKWLLSDAQKLAIVCCKQCVVEAKSLDVDPRLPLKVINSSRWHSHWVLTGDAELYERELKTVERCLSSSSGSWSSSSWPFGSRSWRSSSSVSITSLTSLTNSGPGSAMASHDQLAVSECLSELGDSEESDTDTFYDHQSPPTVAQVHSATHSPMRAPARTPEELWRQMQQLQLAAEQTYQITKQNNQLMHDTST